MKYLYVVIGSHTMGIKLDREFTRMRHEQLSFSIQYALEHDELIYFSNKKNDWRVKWK